MSLLFSYNLANYMTGYWLRFIISFRPVYDFFFLLSFCWLAGSSGLGQHSTLPGLGEGRGVGIGSGYWTRLKLFSLVVIFLSRQLY